MQLMTDDKEFNILVKYAGLTSEQTNTVAIIINAYFVQVYTFAEAVRSLVTDLKIDDGVAKKIILAAGVLYYSKLATELQDEIYEQLLENNINYLDLDKQLALVESNIISSDEISSAHFNEREATLDVFKNNLVTALSSPLIDNRELLNETVIYYLLIEGSSFQKELMNALTTNQEKIGQTSLIINGTAYPSTVANWLLDFNANNLLETNKAVRVKYFNNSQNYNKLIESEKNIVRQLVEVVTAVRNYQTFFVQQKAEHWRIIPPLSNTAELIHQSVLQELAEHYNNDVNWLKEKYHFAENVSKFQSMTLKELLDTLNSHPEDPNVVLPILFLLNIMEPSGQSLKNSTLALRIGKGEFYSDILGFQNRPLIRQLLEIAGLSNVEGAVFALLLANQNKNLVGLAYADVKNNVFKWR